MITSHFFLSLLFFTQTVLTQTLATQSQSLAFQSPEEELVVESQPVIESLTNVHAPAYVNIGIIYALEKSGVPNPSIPWFHAALKAINDINNKHNGIYDDILPVTKLRIIHRSANGQFLRGAIKVNEILNVDPKGGVVACIGPTNYDTIRGAAPAFQEAGGIPVFNYYDRTALFGRSDLYPNMMRVLPGSYQDGQVVASLVASYFKWQKVTLFYQSTDSSRLSSQVFHHYATQQDLNILSSYMLDASESDYSEAINDALTVGSRIFIFFLTPSVAVKLLQQGQAVKLFNDHTQIITGEELITSTGWTSLNLPPDQLNTLLNGLIGVSFHAKAPSSPQKDRFLSDWVKQKSTKGYVDSHGASICDKRMDSYNQSYIYQFYPGLDVSKPVKCAGLNYSSYRSHSNLQTELDPMMYGYDAVIAVALGIHQAIYSLNKTRPTGADLHSVLISKNFSFDGLTGKVSFSSEMIKDQLDVGGRLTGLLFDIVNFVPVTTNTTLYAKTVKNLKLFTPIIQWKSEGGFPICNNQTFYNSLEPCVSFQFQTLHNTFPLDSPPPVLHYMSFNFRCSMFFLSAIGIVCILFIASLLFLFRHRRLVKMNRPVLSSIMMLGMLMGFGRVIIVCFHATSFLCRLKFWFEHLAFQLIFGTLVVRSWRVYLVTCTMKRMKVTERQCVLAVLVSIVVTISFLVAITFSDDHNVTTKTITQTQLEFTQQLSCDCDPRNLLIGLYTYNLLVLLVGLIFCWLIRNVRSTVSNTGVLLEGLITTSTVSVILYLVLLVMNLSPNSRGFTVGVVITLILLRLMWIFYVPLVFHLFSGHELDRALTLRKTEKNIFQLIGCRKLSNKIFAGHDTDEEMGFGPASKYHETTTGSSSHLETFGSLKAVERYAKMKNREELNHELQRVNDEIERKQKERACLENMVFASSGESDSSRKSKEHSSHDHEHGHDDHVHLEPVHEVVCEVVQMNGPSDLSQHEVPSSENNVPHKNPTAQ